MGTKLKTSQKKDVDLHSHVVPVQLALERWVAACAEIGGGHSTGICCLKETFGYGAAIRRLKTLSRAAAKTLVLDSYEEAVVPVAFLVASFDRRADADSLNIRDKSSRRPNWRNLQQGRFHAQALRDWLANPRNPLPLFEVMALSAFVGVDELPKMGRKGEQHGPRHNIELERLCRAAVQRRKSHTWVRSQVALDPRHFGFSNHKYSDKAATIDRGIRSALKRLKITLVRRSAPD